MNFAVFASGNGGNFQAIINAVKARKVKAKCVLVFSNKSDAYVLERARKAKVATLTLNPHDFKTREEFDREVIGQLKLVNVDFIVLAGYMRLLSSHFINQYENRIINIHPSLLPAFKGAHALKDAFDAGVKVTGVSVHFVVNEVDAGPIIAQEPVAISPKDTLETLEAKIHKVEHKLYPQAVDLFARGKLTIKGNKVIIK